MSAFTVVPEGGLTGTSYGSWYWDWSVAVDLSLVTGEDVQTAILSRYDFWFPDPNWDIAKLIRQLLLSGF